MKILKFVVAALLLAGCASTDPGQKAADEATANLPLKVTVGKSDILLDYSKTIVVPTIYVKFLVSGRTAVSKQGGYQIGKDSNSVKASATYKVLGLDKAMAQEISKKVYNDLITKLRGAGYKVLTYDDVKDRDYVKKAGRATPDSKWGLPLESSLFGRSDEYITAAPSDEQQFEIPMQGVFWEFISMGKPKFEDATMLIPTYTITAPQVWGKTDSSYSTISAEINTAPGMNLTSASAPWMGAPKFGMGGGNAIGVHTKAQVVNVIEKAGELVKTEDTTPTTANALSAGLSALFGGGSISASSSAYTFTIDKKSYTEGVLKGTGQFNDVLAKVAASATAE